MRKHIFQSNITELIKQGQELLKENADVQLAYKVSMVLLVLQGMPAAQLAEYANCDARTIQLWVNTVDSAGFEALRPQQKPGRPSRLTDEQKKEIEEVLSKDSSLCGYTVWDGTTLSTYIAETYGVTLGTRACQNLFHELGFSMKRPQTYPFHGQDEQPREEF